MPVDARFRSRPEKGKSDADGRAVWTTGETDVFYHPDLDGGGRLIAPHLVPLVRSLDPNSAAGDGFTNALEWCSGPGFIGFALLDSRLCERVSFADINDRALEYVRKTARYNKLADRVDVRQIASIAELPTTQQYDLVVANPPNYYGLCFRGTVGYDVASWTHVGCWVSTARRHGDPVENGSRDLIICPEGRFS